MDPSISTNTQSLSSTLPSIATGTEVTTWTGWPSIYSSDVNTNLNSWATIGIPTAQASITESMFASCPATLTVQQPNATLCAYDPTGGVTPVYGTTTTTTNSPDLSPTATGVGITAYPSSPSIPSSVSSSVAASSAATSSAVISTAATSGGLNTYVEAGTGISGVFGFLAVLIALSSFVNLG